MLNQVCGIFSEQQIFLLILLFFFKIICWQYHLKINCIEFTVLGSYIDGNKIWNYLDIRTERNYTQSQWRI